MSRVIVFTSRMQAMEAFYTGVIGLRVVSREKGWVELSAGGCTIALHKWKGRAAEGPIKLVFYASDVQATRKQWIERGAAMGDIVRFGAIRLCDTADPDGNAIQISNRAPITAK
jgi:catechol-2,3-dioxygenase